MKTTLKGGCTILDPTAPGAGELRCVIGNKFGAKHLSQYLLDLKGDPGPIYAFGNSDVILFTAIGTASVIVSGKDFKMPEHSGLYVRPGEAFQINPEDPCRILITVCPESAVKELNLSVGSNVYAMIKSVALGDSTLELRV